MNPVFACANEVLPEAGRATGTEGARYSHGLQHISTLPSKQAASPDLHSGRAAP